MAAIVFLSAGAAVLRAEEAADAETVELRLCSTPQQVVSVITPRRMVQYQEHTFKGAGGSITIEGKNCEVGVQQAGRKNFVIGLDADGDGKIDRKEVSPIRNGQAVVKLQIKDGERIRPCCVLLDNISIYVQRGTITQVAFDAIPCWAMLGTYGRNRFMLIDSNLDGQYTQDGADAIVIGRSRIAVPLMNYHAFGNTICQINVESDGTSVTITPQKDTPTAKVEHGMGRLAQAIILTNTEGHSYNIADASLQGIPPGTYQFHSGLLSQGRNFGYIKPGRTGSFEIKADNINLVKLGNPFSLQYQSQLAGDKVTIEPLFEVDGALGERYDFRPGFPKDPKPTVAYLNGSQIARTDKFEYG